MKSAEQKISEQKIRTLVTSSYDIQALRILRRTTRVSLTSRVSRTISW